MADRYWVGGTGNWSDNVNHWSASDGGAPNASTPTSSDNVFFNANSFSGASQVVTVDAVASCLDMDWTGATNTPTFAKGVTNLLTIAGNCTFIAAMVMTGTRAMAFTGTGKSLTTNGLSLTCSVVTSGTPTLTIADSLTTSSYFDHQGGTLTLATGVTFTVGGVGFKDGANADAKTLTLNNATVNCTAFDFSTTGASLTLTANTSTFNVSGTGVFAGGTPTGSYSAINLNGTAHTISGTFTCTVLTRNGTATKTDSITLTSGTTLTCTTFAMIGNSATNRLLVQSSTLGTAATVTATNWTGSTGTFDLMDITATNAVDFSAAGLNIRVGDCGGNTGCTFTAGRSLTSTGAGNWSGAIWSDTTPPLPQDDVSCSHSVTMDMPRVGKSITFTGTPTVTLGVHIHIFGSWTQASGMSYSHGNQFIYFRGRSAYTVTTAGKSWHQYYVYAPGGTYTQQDALTTNASMAITNGTWGTNGQAWTGESIFVTGTATRGIALGASTVTLSGTGTATRWGAAFTGLAFTAGTSTIVVSSSGALAQTFAGGGLTYNNVTIAGAGNYALTVSGSNTFNTLTVDRSAAAKTIKFTDGTTQTVTNFICATSSTTVVTLNGTSTAGWTITKAGGGVISLDYIAVSYGTFTPANTWFLGPHSYISTGTVTGAIFGSPGTGNSIYVPMLF